MRVIVSLTTVPSRMKYIAKTLASINMQDPKPDEIYLCIPYISQCEDSEYQIPLEINNYCNIVRCQDYGPITKLIGVLPIETDPNTIIITMDDDVIYPEGTVQKLLARHSLNFGSAIGSAGYKIGSFPFYYSEIKNQHDRNNHAYSFIVPPDGELVDVLDSSPGILYLRKFFPSAEHLDRLLRYSILTDDTIKNDNLVISAYLSKVGVPRMVFKMPRITEIKDENEDTFGRRSARICSAIKAYRALCKGGLFVKCVKYNRTRTITYPIIVGFVILIVCTSLLATRQKISQE